MKVYTVHEPPGPGEGAQLQAQSTDRIERAERIEFVADGFDWTAALFAPFALLGQNLTAGFALYAAALAAIVALLLAIGATPGWIVLAVIALHTVVGFEAGELRRTKLEADGWSMLGTVTGRSRTDCERRFFDRWLPGQPIIAGLGAAQTPHSGAEADARNGGTPEAGRQWRLPWSRQ